MLNTTTEKNNILDAILLFYNHSARTYHPDDFQPTVGIVGYAAYDFNYFFDFVKGKWVSIKVNWATPKEKVRDMIFDDIKKSGSFILYTREINSNKEVIIGYKTLEEYKRYVLKNINKVYTLLYLERFSKINTTSKTKLEFDESITKFDQTMLDSLVEENYDNVEENINIIVNNPNDFLVSKEKYDMRIKKVNDVVRIATSVQQEYEKNGKTPPNFFDIANSKLVTEIIHEEKKSKFKVVTPQI